MSRVSDYLRRRAQDEALIADFEESHHMKALRRTLARLYGDYASLHDAQNLATRSERIASQGKPAPGDAMSGVLPAETSEAPTQVNLGALASSNRLGTPPAPFRNCNQ